MKKSLAIFLSFFLFLMLFSCQGGNKIAYNTINYGEYPQTIVSDTKLIEKLNELDSSSINSNGYYSYEGKEYAKVVANPYPTKEVYYSTNRLVRKGRTDYFLVEPIEWRITKSNDATNLLLSTMILDNTAYSLNNELSYKDSNLRLFLNNDFYNLAFSKENNKPIETKIDSFDNDGNTIYTNDKVSIPSTTELLKDYGFLSNDDRYTFATDYARAKGADVYINDGPNSYFYNASLYPTRSYAEMEEKKGLYYVDFFGKLEFTDATNLYSCCSVRPSILISK